MTGEGKEHKDGPQTAKRDPRILPTPQPRGIIDPNRNVEINLYTTSILALEQRSLGPRSEMYLPIL